MKWFKHISDSLDDPFIFDLISQFGGDGYLVFFGSLEIISREFNQNTPGICQISEKFLTKKLQISKKKLREILKFCHFRDRILVSISGETITLNCPKFKNLYDEYTLKSLKGKRPDVSGQTPESVGSLSGVCRKKILSETETEKDYIDNTYVLSAGGSAPAPTGPLPEQGDKGKKQPIEPPAPEVEKEPAADPAEAEKVKRHFSEIVGHLLPVMESMAKDISNCKPDKGFNPFAFIQKKVNDGIHPEIIVSALKVIRENWGKMEKDPWSYTSKLIKRAQIEKETAGYKAMTFADLNPDVAKLLKQMLTGVEMPKDEKQKFEDRKAELRKQAEIMKGGFLKSM